MQIHFAPFFVEETGAIIVRVMLSTPFTDAAIAELISEAKIIPDGLCTPIKAMSERSGHCRKEYEIVCDSGNCFVVKIRLSSVNPMDFSAILGYRLPGSFTIFRLRRYNGRHHHTNILENEHFYDFHIHTATERYQRPGFKEDHFAKVTNRHYNLESAVRALLDECGFRSPLEDGPLFKKT